MHQEPKDELNHLFLLAVGEAEARSNLFRVQAQSPEFGGQHVGLTQHSCHQVHSQEVHQRRVLVRLVSSLYMRLVNASRVRAILIWCWCSSARCLAASCRHSI